MYTSRKLGSLKRQLYSLHVPRGYCALAVCAILFPVAAAPLEAQAKSPAQASIDNQRALFNALRPVIKDLGGAARVYYLAKSNCAGDEDPPFPALNLQPLPRGAAGMPAVRLLLKNDPNVNVTSDRSGMLRITIGTPSTAILQTRVQTLTLDLFAQYNGLGAVEAIKESSEVAEHRLNVDTINSFLDIIWNGPMRGEPHLPRLIQGVTVDEALDSVVRTLKGIVFYGICERPEPRGPFRFSLDYVNE